MFAATVVSSKGCVDPFLKPATSFDDRGKPARRLRPEPLQRIIDAMGNLILSQKAATMARFEGAKVIHLLQERGAIRNCKWPAHPTTLGQECSQALQELASVCADGHALADGIGALLNELDWYRGASGPYASANFERGHAHAMLIGPGGIEERSDLRVGVTVMAPYTRFPDHRQTHSRVLMVLSKGEFQSDGSEWTREEVGSSIFYPPGRQFAMRCTSRPLLTLWCQRLRS